MESSEPGQYAEELGQYADGFVAWLGRLGYSPRTCEAQVALLRHLGHWLTDQGLPLSGLTSEVAGEYAAARRGRAQLRSERALRPVLSYLRELGAVPSAAVVVPREPVDVLLARFGGWLSRERGLAPATVSSYLHQARPFAHACARQFGTLTAGRAIRKGRGPGRAAEFLAFGRAARGGLRNEPMMALLLRLALRAGEAAGLLLDDIAWRHGVITVRGKRNRVDQVPLPADVGGPLARYLRDGRPAGTARRQVFPALDAPHAPVTHAAVTSVAGLALRDAGISGDGAAPLLRHTAACGVLAAGGGLAEAGQLLRHAGPEVTAVYARSDITALRSIARPWPEGEPR